MTQFETVTIDTDLLICGGGMAACGAAVEASYWAKQHGLKVTLVDKRNLVAVAFLDDACNICNVA